MPNSKRTAWSYPIRTSIPFGIAQATHESRLGFDLLLSKRSMNEPRKPHTLHIKCVRSNSLHLKRAEPLLAVKNAKKNEKGENERRRRGLQCQFEFDDERRLRDQNRRETIEISCTDRLHRRCIQAAIHTNSCGAGEAGHSC